ncbi:MAG: galactose-1-phosphate uridylyltransferase [Deltaproteobacteria bacterium]|nr:galactose-1-phosphate uridylyltransferase [Deltaproteobacteria bacterium]
MPELRKDPIVGRWVIISTERAQRPSDFKIDKEEKKGGFCPFCYGNEHITPPEVLAYRQHGQDPNKPGWSLRVVPNKFPALMIEGSLNKRGDGVYDMMNGIGAHEVIVESPDHNKTLANLSDQQFEDVLWSFRDRIIDLKKDKRFRYILVFKNHGQRAGASLEHSHCQLIALPILPKTVIEELTGSNEYYSYKERCLYCDIITQEIEDQKRVVLENEEFIVICPFAPRFPFEVWILPKNHAAHFEDATKHEVRHLAQIFQRTLKKLEKALNDPPYNFMIHTAPLTMHNPEVYHWHIELTPRLTRMAGFERGSGFYINPTAPEVSAQFLREVDA